MAFLKKDMGSSPVYGCVSRPLEVVSFESFGTNLVRVRRKTRSHGVEEESHFLEPPKRSFSVDTRGQCLSFVAVKLTVRTDAGNKENFSISKTPNPCSTEMMQLAFGSFASVLLPYDVSVNKVVGVGCQKLFSRFLPLSGFLEMGSGTIQ